MLVLELALAFVLGALADHYGEAKFRAFLDKLTK